MKMKEIKFLRWFFCFVEWVDDDGQTKLSVIPWWVWLWDKITLINFSKYVPPWKIRIGD